MQRLITAAKRKPRSDANELEYEEEEALFCALQAFESVSMKCSKHTEDKQHV